MGLTSFSDFLKGQDVFGHPVTINYRGEDAYNTAWGAFLTIVQKVFILVIAVMGVLDLLAYKDPNIVQYTIYDKRNDDSELNLAENKGGFIFAIGNDSVALVLEYSASIYHNIASNLRKCFFPKPFFTLKSY